MFAAILLASSLIAGQFGTQWFEPRESYETPTRVQVSQVVMRSMMINRVTPNYSREAKRRGIRGTVFLNFAVDEKGRASDIKVFSGHPLLVPITVEAVKRLRFRPYCLNGEAVPVSLSLHRAAQDDKSKLRICGWCGDLSRIVFIAPGRGSPSICRWEGVGTRN